MDDYCLFIYVHFQMHVSKILLILVLRFLSEKLHCHIWEQENRTPDTISNGLREGAVSPPIFSPTTTLTEVLKGL